MKKKIFLIPKRNTDVPEEVIIEKGKIKEIFYMQLAEEMPENVKIRFKKPIKDSPIHVKVYSCEFRLKKLHPEAIKENKLDYTHEILIEYTISKNPNEAPSPEAIVKLCFGDHKRMYAKFSWFEVFKIKYYSFSWSKLTINQRLTIITIIITTILGLLAIF